MAKRSRKESSAADLLVSPLPKTSPSKSPSESPVEFEFKLNAFNTTTSSSKKNFNRKNCGASTPVPMQPTGSPPSLKNLSTISDLKNLAVSKMESIKRQLDRSHLEILKDVEASQSRLHKRFKIQTQACQQVMDEADRECKKMVDQIDESREAMKASYAEFIAAAQASASRACKTSIPKLSQSFEKAVDAIKSRYGIPSTSA
ncbi:unnamed protein product [Ilex paraguariensis]|uniref:Uncharacterized protein n=1 Tax=Ilex paraguariensis TaxID=185542 RepID=A0ABC8U4S9_9AQUA